MAVPSANAGGSKPHQASAASDGGSREAGLRGASTAEQAEALKATYGLKTADEFDLANKEATKVDARGLANGARDETPGNNEAKASAARCAYLKAGA